VVGASSRDVSNSELSERREDGAKGREKNDLDTMERSEELSYDRQAHATIYVSGRSLVLD